MLIREIMFGVPSLACLPLSRSLSTSQPTHTLTTLSTLVTGAMQHALPRRPARAPCAARHPLPRRAAASASASASSAPPSVVPSPPSRPRPTPEQAASAVALLRAAADGASPPPADVCAAMRTLEQARPAAPPAQLATALSAPNRWRLLFTSSGADMRSKAGGGRYWPTFLKACISWDVKTLTLRNAVALGHLAGLQFEDGPMRQKGWRCARSSRTLGRAG